MKKIIIILLVFLFVIPGYSDELIRDNFDNTADMNCNDPDPPYPPSPWYTRCGGCRDLGGDYSAEIKGPGRGGTGKAFYTYLWGSIGNNFASCLGTLGSWGQRRTVYTRWYWYVDSRIADVSPAGFHYIKMWRYNTNIGNQVYVNINNGWVNTGGVIEVYGTGPGNDAWSTIISMSDLPLDQWIYCELRITLSSTGASDGILEFWINNDDSPYYSNTLKNYGTTSTEYFQDGVNITSIGFGNVGTDPETVFQSTPYAARWDDFVVSDTFVGEVGFEPQPEVSITGVSINSGN